MPSPNISKEQAYRIIVELSDVYPDNLRMKIARMGVESYLEFDKTIIDIENLKNVPVDLLEQYAVILVKNRKWDTYRKLIYQFEDINTDHSYFDTFKIYYHIIRKEENEAKSLFQKLNTKNDFLLNSLLFILCSEKESSKELKRHILEIEALQFDFDNRIDEVLSTYFHAEDVEYLSKLYTEKVK